MKRVIDADEQLSDRVVDRPTAHYEQIIREAVREAMRAPELIDSTRALRDEDRALLVSQLKELRALLVRLLDAIEASDA